MHRGNGRPEHADGLDSLSVEGRNQGRIERGDQFRFFIIVLDRVGPQFDELPLLRRLSGMGRIQSQRGQADRTGGCQKISSFHVEKEKKGEKKREPSVYAVCHRLARDRTDLEIFLDWRILGEVSLH